MPRKPLENPTPKQLAWREESRRRRATPEGATRNRDNRKSYYLRKQAPNPESLLIYRLNHEYAKSGKRICRACQTLLPLDDYHFRRVSRSNKLSGTCRACTNAREREYRARRKMN